MSDASDTFSPSAVPEGDGAGPASAPAAEKSAARPSRSRTRRARTEAAPGAALTALPFCVPRATSPRPVPPGARLDDPSLYFNRELSWLDFNWRVLAQAIDERTPLLERVRFLCITYSNLDEFFRKRVGGLKRQAAAGVTKLNPDGRTPGEQLALAREAALTMHERLNSVWEETLKPLLHQQVGIKLCAYSSLDAADRAPLDAYFLRNIFPILTPLAVDPGHPFPHISNLSLSLAVLLRHPVRGTEHFARIKVPTSRGRWVPLPGKPRHYVPVEDIIRHNLHELFRGMEVESAHAFRITRNAEVGREDEEVDDLLEMISDELRERRFAPVVRLEVDADMPHHARELLMRELSLTADDVYETRGIVDLSGCNELAAVNAPQFSYPPWEPIVPTRLKNTAEGERNIFDVIRHQDLLVHHPYESFRATTQRFVEDAALDPRVVAIKQTLYRTSDQSPVIEALIRAAEEGKQVAVLVEVKARFDEENNMEWGARLEKAGVHVTYGLVGLKTHAKVTLVVREEDDGLRAYCHFGTGNYNPSTARFYTDLGLLTCKADLGHDLVNLFHYLTGYAPEQRYRRLLVAPRAMRRRFVELIRHEVARQQQDGTGRIVAKMNALDDVGMIEELYRASQAGVPIDLVVRGHCRLRPGVAHFSENIRVRSIVGRFLEHSRVYCFGQGERARLFIGSADWQRRNLDDRVETIVEVEDGMARGRLMRLLEMALADERQSWVMASDGSYQPLMPTTPAREASFQEVLMERARGRVAEPSWDL